MIRHVTFGHTTFNGLPFKFEAGTPDYVATTGLARALDYVSALGMDNIHAHEQELTRYALERMRRVPGMRILGEAEERDAVISFLVGGIHHLDMGTLLDRLGIAVRTGHHCAEPLMRRLGMSAARSTLRMSRSPMRKIRRCSSTSRCTSGPARPLRWSARPAAAKARCAA